MIVTPQVDNFLNDRYDIQVFEDYFVTLVIVDETFENAGKISVINEIKVVASFDVDGVSYQIPCPSIIGMENDLISLETSDPSLLGQKLSKDNIGQWRIVINE